MMSSYTYYARQNGMITVHRNRNTDERGVELIKAPATTRTDQTDGKNEQQATSIDSVTHSTPAGSPVSEAESIAIRLS